MRQCGGFQIELKDYSYQQRVYNLLLECLENMDFRHDNFWVEYMTENLDVDYEIFIDFEDYSGYDKDNHCGPAIVEMSRAIASEFPELEFDGVSHWYNSTSGFMLDYIIHYNGKEMQIYSIEYCESDDWAENQCPNCESSHLLIELWDGGLQNIIPTEVYCVNCGETFPLEKIADLTILSREEICG